MGEALVRISVFIVDIDGPDECRRFRRRAAPPESRSAMGLVFLPGDREVERMPPCR